MGTRHATWAAEALASTDAQWPQELAAGAERDEPKRVTEGLGAGCVGEDWTSTSHFAESNHGGRESGLRLEFAECRARPRTRCIRTHLSV